MNLNPARNGIESTSNRRRFVHFDVESMSNRRRFDVSFSLGYSYVYAIVDRTLNALQNVHETLRYVFRTEHILRAGSKTSFPRKILLKIYSTRNVYYSVLSKIFLGDDVLERSPR